MRQTIPPICLLLVAHIYNLWKGPIVQSLSGDVYCPLGGVPIHVSLVLFSHDCVSYSEA